MSRILATVPTTYGVTFAGTDGFKLRVETRVLNADTWLEAILGDGAGMTWTTLLGDVLEPVAAEAMSDALYRGRITHDEVFARAQELLKQAAGRPWWEAINLLILAEESWPAIGGDMALHGILPQRVTLGTWCDAAWILLRRIAAHKSEQALNQMVTEVQRKPLAEDDDGSMDIDEFMAAAADSRGR